MLNLVQHLSSAQTYIPFPDSNAIWTSSRTDVTCPDPLYLCYNNQNTLNGDTVIGSYTYKKIYSAGYSQNPIYPYNTTYYHGYTGAIRNDIAEKKVYFVPSNTTTDTLFYDFSLVVGDTLPVTYIYSANFPQPCTISSIDSIYSGGLYRKWYNIYNPDIGNLTSYIEGIGNTGGLFESIYYPEGYSDLLCFIQNDSILYPEGTSNTDMCRLIAPPNCNFYSVTPTVTVSGNTLFCNGDSIVLTAEDGFISYLWSTGDTTQSISADTSGIYSVSVQVNDSCWFSSSTVQTYQAVLNPVIIIGDELYVSHFYSYQWYLNGEPIPGAVEQTYCPFIWGGYSVVVHNSIGCSAVSGTVEINSEDNFPCTIGLSENAMIDIIMYPNPARTSISIQSSVIGNQSAISIYNALGQLVYQLTNQPVTQLTIDISTLPTGLYYLTLQSDEGVAVKKFEIIK